MAFAEQVPSEIRPEVETEHFVAVVISQCQFRGLLFLYCFLVLL